MVRQNALIAATALGKRHEGRWIFRGVELSIGSGECLLVTGRNGSGKSTLLKLLAGIESPSEGRVDSRARIGYSAPDLQLYPSLTAVEHLEFAAALRGCRPKTSELLERMGLSADAHRYAGAYSTGMRARLRLAIAIQAEPEVLILDEPTATLDAEGRRLVDELVRDQRLRGAIVIATNSEEDRKHGDWEICLDA
jgi:ABC-type multidrug transport system ATPase subunit